jgi:hypothetical protein
MLATVASGEALTGQETGVPNTNPPTPAPIPDPAPHNAGLGHYYSPAGRGRINLDQIAYGAAVRFLLGTVGDPALTARIDDRLQLPPAVPHDTHAVTKIFGNPAVPTGVARWLLESGDETAYLVAFRMTRLPEAVLRDITLGVPYPDGGGSIRPARLSLTPSGEDPHYRSFRIGRADSVDDEGDATARGLVHALYTYGAQRRMKQVRHVVAAIGARDWAVIGAADRATPLPGYARWALCVHPVCPVELRVQFGGTLPRFAKRMRNAGVLLGGPGEYLRTGRNPEIVLAVFGLGGALFPEQCAAARAELRPLVERELGGNLEAWAVLDRLLPQFTGSVPELIGTSGAIAAATGG